VSLDVAPALATLAARACEAAGTDLEVVLADLRDGAHDERTPAALRAGWAALDLDLHPATTEEAP
jgi:hypothetical protein